MKKLLFIFFALLCFSAKSQVYEHFSGYGTIGAPSRFGQTDSLTFNIYGYVPDTVVTGKVYTIADISVGDVFFTKDCNKYIITRIPFKGSTLISCVGKKVFSVINSFPIIDTRIGVTREYNANGFITFQMPKLGGGTSGDSAGITSAMKTCIQSYYYNLDSVSLQAQSQVVKYVGNGVPSSTLATVNGYKVAQGSAFPNPIYRWNGSSWIFDGNGSIVNPNLTQTKAVSTTYTLALSDVGLILCSTAVTITLPTAASAAGIRYHFVKTDSGNTTTVKGSGSELINGANTSTLTTQYARLAIQSDGTQWWIISQ